MLSDLGFEFATMSKKIDERYPKDYPVSRVAVYLAEKKAMPFEDLSENNIIITADTVVIKDLKILGKPSSEDEARDMLRSLSGNCHEVISGFCICHQRKYYVDSAVTYVFFRDLEEKEINYYVKNYSPVDKAGSYGIQEWIGMIGIERIEGSFYNVMGLPVVMVYDKLRRLNLVDY